CDRTSGGVSKSPGRSRGASRTGCHHDPGPESGFAIAQGSAQPLGEGGAQGGCRLRSGLGRMIGGEAIAASNCRLERRPASAAARREVLSTWAADAKVLDEDTLGIINLGMRDNPPVNTGDDAITRGRGVNPAERYLNRLAERTFLSMWSYPCLYRARAK